LEKEKIGTKRLEEKRDESIHQILDAAIEAFAEDGYEGARIDEIAERAGVNKAMIYYRIGDKKTLYDEVIHHVFHNAAKRITENIRDNFSPQDKLKIYIANFAKAMAQHPAFPKIMVREMASGWTHFNEEIINDMAGILVIVRDIIDEGVKKGVFINVNPMIVHMMTIGTMLLFNLSTPVRKNYHHILGEKINIMENTDFDHVLPDIEKMILRALKA